jgi:hypothetical protein
MFEVSEYLPPHIFVTTRRTGESYIFLVERDGTLSKAEARFEEGIARRAAVKYLALRERGTAQEFAATG